MTMIPSSDTQSWIAVPLTNTPTAMKRFFLSMQQPAHAMAAAEHQHVPKSLSWLAHS
jgi:hypothetical protein